MLFAVIFMMLFATGNKVFAQCDSLLFNEVIPDSMMLCRRDTIRFVHLPDSAYRYNWSNGSTKSYFVADMPSTIYVRIENRNDFQCYRMDTIVVQFHPKPILTQRLNIDTTLCYGDSITLTVSGMENVSNYIWHVPTDPSIRDTNVPLTVHCDSAKFAANVYNYIVQMQGVCNYRALTMMEYTIFDTAFVFFALPPKTNLGTDTTFCPMDDFKLTALSETLYDYRRYNIFWDGGPPNDNTFGIDANNMGLHFVRIDNGICGDIATDSIEIYFYPVAWTESHLVPDTGTCEKIPIILDASVPYPFTTYLWLHDSTIHPVVTVSKAAVYTCVLTDSAGCSRSFEATVENESCDPKIEMANVFTPNGDGANDFFFPKTKEKIENFEITIYSNWGMKVYEFKGDVEEMQWNGTHKSKLVPTGVYFWHIKYNDLYGKAYKDSGTVTLMR
ncbi:MAG: gliding motility-associated C-terminal domain-containing protein [Bacteroidales bacterium]|nr:gliding motility-associated C-terminal domain-containing protein [Bacteroidales bacterium]